jgi:hypothetical protein
MAGWKGIPCVIYKDNEEIGTFESIKEAAIFLENRIEGSLEPGVQALIKGWVPPKASQLYGYSAKRLD